MKYYVFDNANNKYESLTKEEILTAIVQAIETHEISDVDTGFVTKLQEGNKNIQMSVWIGTTAEYNAIETKQTNCLYILTDDTELEDLQTEIDTINSSLQSIQDDITDVDTQIGTLTETVGEAVEDVSEMQSAVDDMQDDVTDLQTDMTAAQSAITTAQGNITTLQGNVNDLSQDVSTAQSQVSAMGSRVNNLGADVTQLEADVDFYSDKVMDIENKNGAVLLNQIVQPEHGGVDLIGDYTLDKFNVVKVMFVDSLYYNKEVLCNVYHNSSNTKIVGTYLDVDPDSGGLEFKCIYLNCDEINNELSMNYSKKVTMAGVSAGLPIAKITGVC